MKSRATRRSETSPASSREAADVERALQRAFTTEVVDDLRAGSGYNPRQRVATAHRLLLTVVEAFLVGQTLSFAALRAIFVRRFGFVRSCPFQKRFKQESAVTFFRAALEHLVDSVVSAAGLELKGSLAKFEDVRVYDATGQRVPPRGRAELPACGKGRAGTKCLVGYSVKTGLVEQVVLGAETASESPITTTYAWFLASWAKVLSWTETARRFGTSWHVRHFQKFFGELGNVSAATAAQYGPYRLGHALRRTVKKELSALRGFFGWCDRLSPMCRP